MSDTPSSSRPTVPPPPRPSIRTIPPLVLLSFAVIHSQVYWLYSVFYHLCHNLPDRSLDPSLNETIRNALTKGSGGRARAFSEPQQASAMMLQHRRTITAATTTTTTTKRRPRSTTISASTVDTDGPLRRQQWVERVNACLDEGLNEESMKREYLQQTVIMDERLGRTRPPRWWQRTKRHLLTRQDIKEDESDSSNVSNSNVASTLSLPAITSSSTVRTSLDSTMLGGMTVTNPPSVSPPTCDIQPSHHEITTIDDPFLKDNQPITSSSSSDISVASSLLSTLSTKATISIHGLKPSILKDDPLPLEPPQPPPRRPLAKIRSVFVKSQIEPEKARQLEPKRRTILGIPSRWSNPSNKTPLADSTEHAKKTVPTKKRQSVRIQEPSPSSQPQKKHLFSSLPNWKRKSVG